MSTLSQKRSVMTLFSGKSDIESHQVRIALAEKGVACELELVEPGALPEELKELNPYRTLPTLIDRSLVLYDPRIIMEYLDERFPHPPLMPVYPVARAHSRLIMYRMQRDWYGAGRAAFDLMASPDTRLAAQERLKEELEAVCQVFESFNYFMHEEFSLLDCYLAPLLWRLACAGQLPSAEVFPAFHTYLQRLFQRPCFEQALTSSERHWGQPEGELLKGGEASQRGDEDERA